MSEVEELAAVQVRMKSNGDLIQRVDGTEILVAHYDRTSGHLEFTSKENSVKLYNQCVSKISTVSKGTQPSGLTIKTIGVKGAPAPKKGLPKRPALGPLGDAAEDIVSYYLENDPAQAIIRYGIYTDSKGQMIRRPVRRVVETINDDRATHEDADLPWIQTGPKTQEKGPVNKTAEVIQEKSGIIARRATALTFTPQEVVGGFQPEEDYDETPAAALATEDES